MDYQILVLDLDGTLTNSKKEVSSATLEALLDIQNDGKTIVLASGRPTQGVAPLAKKLNLDQYGGYILSYNGGHIIDCRSGEVVYNKPLPKNVYSQIYDLCAKYKEHGIDLITYQGDNIISAFGPNEYTRLESRINRLPIIQPEPYFDAVTAPINKFLGTGDPAIIEKIREESLAMFHSYLNIYCSEPFFLEFMPQNIDKAHSLQRLLSSIGLTAEEMICCGDGYNDISMIEYAGLGVAMANAQSVVLEKADFITKSNDDDGIVHVIDTFLR